MQSSNITRRQRVLTALVVLSLAIAALAAATAPASPAATSYTPTDLGTLGGSISGSTAINDRGHVIGQSTTAEFTTHSFLWTPETGMIDIGTLGGPTTQALALSDSGHVVGWSDTATGVRHAFSWTRDGGIIDLGTFGGPRSRAAAVNDSGRVVGWSETGDGISHAFTWTADGGMVDLGPGVAADVNDAGQVVGGGDGGAFLWTQGGGKVLLGTLGGTHGSASAINDQGEVTGVAQTASAATHPFFWSAAGGMVDIGTLGPSFAIPVAINESGQVAGWGPAVGGNHAFLWSQATGIVDLGSPGVSVTVQGLNDAGRIVGTTLVTFPAFEIRAFSWTATDGYSDFGPLGPPTTVAVNAAGQIAANAFVDGVQHAVVWSPAGTPPVVTSTASTSFTVGVQSTFTVTSSGSPTPTITLEGLLPDGLEFVDRGDGTATLSGTAAPGTGGVYSLTLVAENGIEPDATQAFTLRVEYEFSGFFAPIETTSVNDIGAGRAVPVKFGLGGDQGLAILAPGSPRSAPVDCDDLIAPVGSEPTETAGASELSFDPAANAPDGLYTYVWKTDRAWAGTCRQLQLTLRDGRMYTAAFRFAQ